MKESTIRRKRLACACIERGCRKKAGKKKPRCDMHHARIWDSANPLRRSWINKKADAKRKGRLFTFTYPQWERLAIEGGLMQKRGRQRDSMTVDRMENGGGYTPENSRIIPNSENAAKGTNEYLGPHWKYLNNP